MGTLIFVTIPLSYAYYKFIMNVGAPIAEAIIDGVKDTIKENKARKQQKKETNKD